MVIEWIKISLHPYDSQNQMMISLFNRHSSSSNEAIMIMLYRLIDICASMMKTNNSYGHYYRFKNQRFHPLSHGSWLTVSLLFCVCLDGYVDECFANDYANVWFGWTDRWLNIFHVFCSAWVEPIVKAFLQFVQVLTLFQ